MSESLPANKKAKMDTGGSDGGGRVVADADDDELRDATVVVGGKEFREHSNFLCYISGYFRGAIRSGMKESDTLHFTFPDKDPSEWRELFMSLMKPRSQVRLTEENVEVILHWCTELIVTVANKDIVDVFSKKIAWLAPNGPNGYLGKSNIEELLRLLGTFETYGLDENKKQTLEMIEQYLNHQGDEFDAVNIARILDILRENKDDDCYSGLRNIIVSLIPSALVEQLRDLPYNEILPHLIVCELVKKDADKIRQKTKTAIQEILPGRLYTAVYWKKTEKTAGECKEELRKILTDSTFWRDIKW